MRWRIQHRKRHLDRPTGPANPFESYLLIICTIQGFAVICGYARPPSIDALLPDWLRYVWGLLLLVGGFGAVTGLYWPRDPLDGAIIKRIGLIAAGGGTLAYGVALLDLGPVAFVAAAFNLGFTVACFTRAWQVTRILDAFRADLATIRRCGGRKRE